MILIIITTLYVTRSVVTDQYGHINSDPQPTEDHGSKID